jgi:antibiotic biosynthesis monooxygenase (ABM) superfamily enzyme
MPEDAAIARVWRGWTTAEDADAYQAIAVNDVFPAILAREIPGLISAQVMRADDTVNDEVEFTTIIWFDSLDSVKGFMGENYRQAHLPEIARAVLKRFESEAKHFRLVADID